MMKTFRPGGIHPPENKLTADGIIRRVELPREVIVTFSQHIGAMAECVVEKGEHVLRGQLIAKASGFVSANIHAPISGTVTRIDKWKTALGYPADTVTIVADDDDHRKDETDADNVKKLRSDSEVENLKVDEIVGIVSEAGIVGLGGATFPTRVKLTPPKGSKAEVLIINGVECEPFLTNDHVLMLNHPTEIIKGIKILMKAANVDKAVIGIEANKKDAVRLLRDAVGKTEGIEVAELKVKYPQGGEKQLIEAITGKEVPEGGLPISVGAIVQNVATVYAVYEAVYLGKPLIERIVTVTGPSLSGRGNFLAPIGMKISQLIDIAGGIPGDTGKIILGGPMMGKAIVAVDAPTTKGVSGILLLPESMSRRKEVEPCIRCASCVSACPMGLMPYLLSTLSRMDRWDELEENKVMNCIECGCCSYSCPSARPLLDYIRLGKATVGGIIRSRQTKK